MHNYNDTTAKKGHQDRENGGKVIAPVSKLRKLDIVWLAEHYCRHKHNFLSHYQCFRDEAPRESPFYERIGFLDIEATGLKGNWDFMLCYCLRDYDTKKILGRHVTPKEILTYQFDKHLTKELVHDMEPYHRIIVYYGRDYRYDVPFIRTRAEHWKLNFPGHLDKWVTDVYDIAKSKLCLHRTRLETVCQHLGIPAKGHRLEPDIWQKAQAGHEPSLEWIFKHCKEDVTSLDAAYERLKKYVGHTKRSI